MNLSRRLFSDYALKARFVWMPEGTSAKYVKDEVLDFPVAPCSSKTFIILLISGMNQKAGE
jgi:hypothetical protein